jgi:hypothetical protein
MARIRSLKGALPLLLLALSAVPAPAAEEYLKVIPSTALAWGVVNHMGPASAKIQKLAGVVGTPAPSPLDEFKNESGIRKGIDEQAAGGFFLLPGKTENDPVMPVAFVAIAGEKDFLANFKDVSGEAIKEVTTKNLHPEALPKGGVPHDGPSMFVGFRHGYALLTSDRFKAALEAALASKQDVSAETTGLESWLAENDGTVVGTAAGIKYAAAQAAAELKKARDNDGSMPPEAAALIHNIMDLYGKAVQAAPSEISLAVAGIRYDQQGSIRVTGRARLTSGGQVAKVFAGIPPVKEKLLSAVPGGPFIIAAGGIGIPKLADSYTNLVMGFMKSMKSVYGMSDEDLEKMTKGSLAMMGQVDSMNFVMKTARRGDPIYSNLFMSMHVQNAQKILDYQEQYAGNTGKLIEKAKQGMLKSTSIKRLEIAGRPALEQDVNFDLSGMGGGEANRAVFEEMMGIGGKMVFYHVAADEHMVLMGMGVPQERMAAAIDVVKQPKKSLAEDPDVSVTAAMLPADAQWVLYISPRGYMQMTQRIMAVAMKNAPNGGEGFTIPDFAKSPPIGIAIKAAPAELAAEVAVPAPLIVAVGDYAKEMQKAMMRMMQQQNPGMAPAPPP